MNQKKKFPRITTPIKKVAARLAVAFVAVGIAGGAVGALLGGALGGAAQQSATSDTAYEFLVQKGSSNNVISVVQTNELGLKPGDNVVLVTIDGTTRIRAKF